MRIRIPKGSYVPVFEAAGTIDADPAAPPESDRRKHPAPRPSILVEPFTEEGNQAAYPSFTQGLTRSLVIGLTRFTNLRVFAAGAKPTDAAAYPDRHDDRSDIDYVLSGGTVIGADWFGTDIVLSNARTGRTIWADRFERRLDTSEIFRLRKDVANQIARTLAQPDGVIHSDRAHEAEARPPEQLSSHDCVMQFYQYWRTFDSSMVERVRLCLERTVRSEPGYAEA
ncbi:hypothetical protein AB4144_36670, partial [Rhizobiaceae sp. 2RAB30]